jgi:hypothetical protein
MYLSDVHFSIARNEPVHAPALIDYPGHVAENPVLNIS